MATPQQQRRKPKGSSTTLVVIGGLAVVGVLIFLRSRSSSAPAPLPVQAGTLAPTGTGDTGSSDSGSAPQPAADAAPSDTAPVAAAQAGGYVPFGFGGPQLGTGVTPLGATTVGSPAVPIGVASGQAPFGSFAPPGFTAGPGVNPTPAGTGISSVAH